MRSSLRRILAYAHYSIIPMVKQPMQMITIVGYIFLPMIFMGIFLRDAGAIHGLIGVLVNSAVLSGIFTSQDYVYNRIYFRLQDFLVSSPMKSWEYVAGVTLSTYVIMIPSLALSLVILYYLQVISSVMSLLITLIILLIGGIGFSFLGYLIGTLTNNPTTVNGLSNILVLVLGFLAPVYYPMDLIPPEYRIYTLILPSTPIPELLRQLYNISETSFSIWILGLLILIWNILFIGLSIKVAYWREK